MEDWSDEHRSTETENGRKWTQDWKELGAILDHGVKYVGEDNAVMLRTSSSSNVDNNINSSNVNNNINSNEEEGFQEQIKGFIKSTGELVEKLAQGCKDVVVQSLGGENSVAVRRLGGMWARATTKLDVLNQYLAEDRNPAHVWSVVFFVFFLALAVLRAGTREHKTGSEVKAYTPPITANRIQLPDGRYIAYQEQGVSANMARHSVLVVHSFLFSRLAGIPGIKYSLLEEFGVRLVTYDLPGFGQSDPHPRRNLTSSALDMVNIADALGFGEKFWVIGYSGGGIHAWAAIRYIPERLAGAALFAPMGNPYEPNLTKEEIRKIWEKWTWRRKLGFILAKRASSFLPSFYKRSFLQEVERPDKALSFTFGKKDEALMEKDFFIDFWRKDMRESTRQGSPVPFVQETIMQVNKWEFSLADLQVRKKQARGLMSWLHSLFTEVQEEWEGFLGPIHIWQGTDDRVVPYPLNDYAKRMVPGSTLHKLIGEGHFSYFCFCDDCHKEIFFTLFGIPKGASNKTFVPESLENDRFHDTMNE